MLIKLILSLVSLSLATGGQAEETTPVQARGLAKVVGSSYNRHLIIKNENKITKICSSEVSRKISKLTSYEILVTGTMATELGSSSCLKAESFAIIKAASGRPAVTGILKRANDRFYIQDDRGKSTTVKKLSRGLKKLEGKRVVVDLKTNKNNEAKVVSYMEHP